MNCEDKKYVLGTYSGLNIDFNNIRTESICIQDIATALNNKCRFNGHINPFYSVATHCLNVERCLELMECDIDTRIKGLLHDAPEAYIGDMTRPLRRKLMTQNDTFEELDSILMDVILEKFGLKKLSPAQEKLIKLADDTCLILEARALNAKFDLFEKQIIMDFKVINPYNQNCTMFETKLNELLQIKERGII